jgi:hypothetical protein
MPDGRFPPPWTVEDNNDACYIVRDKTATRSRMSIMNLSLDAAPQLIC